MQTVHYSAKQNGLWLRSLTAIRASPDTAYKLVLKILTGSAMFVMIGDVYLIKYTDNQ